ncbi:6-phosphofructokinase [Plasmodium gonderi]|uniref:6-phosphofructokinase n=1 Tax=Plasmodium gonderi TaxID=77519 RepID=A0A1Y1JKW1_PLAGO|nr:6-phosphofructokinase [Plasmodium gonderi]GAW81053.1 6-phosphofructokinase [Plasmodium gonderi]
MDIENAKKHLSELQKERRKKKITLPHIFRSKTVIKEESNDVVRENGKCEVLEKHFPYIISKPIIHLCAENEMVDNLKKKKSFNETGSTKLFDDISVGNCTENSILREMIDMSIDDETLNLGVLFTGLTAPGGHNIICGILDSLKKKNKKNILYGFLNGFEGVKKYCFMELKNEYISMFRNSGGFDMIKTSSFDSLKEIEKKKCFKICRHLNLAGLIIVGDVESSKQITHLAEYFEKVNTTAKQRRHKASIVGSKCDRTEDEANQVDIEHFEDDRTYEIVSDLSDEEIKAKYPRKRKNRNRQTSIVCAPKTVYNEMKSKLIECSLGFDTTIFSYCQYISYLISHVKTYQSGYHFVKVIGNSSSHVALECFLQTKVNIVLVSEEIKKKKKKLKDIINFIAHVVQTRYQMLKKKYGIIITPEGLLGKIVEFKKMVKALICAKKQFENFTFDEQEIKKKMEKHLDADSMELFHSLPLFFQKNLLDEIKSEKFQYSRLKTEELLLTCVKKQIEEKKIKDIKFVSHSYENDITCSLPSNFDCAYSYILGLGCVEIVENNYNGYLCIIRNLKNLLHAPQKVELLGVPLSRLMRVKKVEIHEGKKGDVKREGSWDNHDHLGHEAMSNLNDHEAKSNQNDHEAKSNQNDHEAMSNLNDDEAKPNLNDNAIFVKKKKINLSNTYFLKYKKYRCMLLYADMYRTHCGIQFESNMIEDNDECALISPNKLNKIFSSPSSKYCSKWSEIFNRINFTLSGFSGKYLCGERCFGGIHTEVDYLKNEVEKVDIHEILQESERIKPGTSEDATPQGYEHVSECRKEENEHSAGNSNSSIKCSPNCNFKCSPNCNFKNNPNCNFKNNPNCNVSSAQVWPPSEIEQILSMTTIKFNTNLIRHNSEIVYVDSHFESSLNLESFEYIDKIKEIYVIREKPVNMNKRSRCNDKCTFVKTKNVGLVILSHSVPGVNNIIAGLHERLSMNNIKLIGFLKGIRGLLNNDVCIIKDSYVRNYVNLGGAALLGVQLEWNKRDGNECGNSEIVGIHDLMKEKYMEEIIKNCRKNRITNLVFIGDEKVISLMNILNDKFIKKKVDIKIVTVPISLYNSFYKNLIECSIGYHSMVHTMSDIIGNLQTYTINMNTFYYFVKIPTNISSSSLLSIQLQTHCNICLIGECIDYQMITLHELIKQISTIIIERINRKKFYGIILLSSNLIFRITDFHHLLSDVNQNINNQDELNQIINESILDDKIVKKLTKESVELLRICTKTVKEKLLDTKKRQDEDVDANFEFMLVEEIKKYIKEVMSKAKEKKEVYAFKEHMKTVKSNLILKDTKVYSNINYIQHFKSVIKNMDMEINCCFPTHFDNSLAFSHGLLAGIAIENDLVNYVTSIRHLNLNKQNWSSSLYPGCYFLNRNDMWTYDGYPYVAPEAVSVKSSQMATIKHNADTWAYNDCYIFVGPYQHEVNSDSPVCFSHIF